jgi:uncharacterized protein YdhG (YjbR/CyaY superfamily)
MQNNEITTIDEYIAGFPAATQLILEQLRATIKNLVPDVQESISYRIPAFKYHGVLVYFAAYKNHIGFYPTSSGIDAFKEELSEYKGGRGTVQFPINKPIPFDLIEKIVAFRVNENRAKAEKNNE